MPYDNLRLTELHEEWAWSAEAARRWEGDEGRAHLQQRDRFDAEIRARVAIQQPTGPNGPEPRRSACELAVFRGGVPLKCGITDAERVYPRKRNAVNLPYAR